MSGIVFRRSGRHGSDPGATSPTGSAPAPLRIRELTIDPPLLLAPMAGVADLPYRCLMADFGAGMVTTEMISVEGLIRNHPGSWRLLDRHPGMRAPQAVQLFGSRPERMAEAARMIEDEGIDAIDINAGCPVRKVARQGAGAKLLTDPDLLARLVETVRRSIALPLTVKIRLGWDSRNINAIEVARRLEQAGADAITLHARTAVQLYRGQADWEWIQALRQAVSIPVIGNGDVTSPELADEMLQQTRCNGIMIGRGSLGNPWLFSAIADNWQRRIETRKQPGWEDFLATVEAHLAAFRRHRASPPGHYRKILVWYSKGCPEAARLRADLTALKEPRDMTVRFQRWVEELDRRGFSFLPTKITAHRGTPDEGHRC